MTLPALVVITALFAVCLGLSFWVEALFRPHSDRRRKAWSLPVRNRQKNVTLRTDSERERR